MPLPRCPFCQTEPAGVVSYGRVAWAGLPAPCTGCASLLGWRIQTHGGESDVSDGCAALWRTTPLTTADAGHNATHVQIAYRRSTLCPA